MGIVTNTARLCVMDLFLRGIARDPCPVACTDSLASQPSDRFSLALANLPFGKKSSVAVVSEEGELAKGDIAHERTDFWATTKNQQLNVVKHCR